MALVQILNIYIFENSIFKNTNFYLSLKIVSFDKHAKYREKTQMLYDYDS